ncbi:HAMP domain-containing histidine kinase [filamentous cyanobacterium LEGE 11480]|uniref:histidine kinase n=1 Tax=Romeriopsis navalis LEGE 11480 TaxID=2777977 RepID=A0A928VJ22_9CYAN|nr:HAMP domain-containing sensor histidine kinase [Romeriopsis navalis]MBE9029250.1 HAMP domain-containing histidine kinase [Romeriopsis navalis LEGE 11480]
MRQIDLKTRLFLSHMIVMTVGIATLLAVGKFYSPRFFVEHLQQLEIDGINLVFVKKRLVNGFESAWSRGAFWSMIVGGSMAGMLSYLVSKRIMQPLIQMQKITRKFASGNLAERMPANEIPELNRLADSFNRMAFALEDVEQRRRELVSDLTHELRTPLTVVEGYLEGLADGTIEPEPEIYGNLVRETSRLKRLVNDLQELSKAEAGYLPIQAKPLAVRPLMDELVQRFSDQLLDSPTRIKLDCPENLPRVMADAERVEQVLVNLIGNALRYTPSGDVSLQAWVGEQKQFLWIGVKDTGQGIAPEELPHVFERFWRSDRSRDRNSGGTGIGLAISRRLVELQKGVIRVESQLGQGSFFQFSLPIAKKSLGLSATKVLAPGSVNVEDQMV